MHEDMSGEGVLFFGGSSGTIQEHLLSNYKENNNDLKDKYTVT